MHIIKVLNTFYNYFRFMDLDKKKKKKFTSTNPIDVPYNSI